MAVRAVRLLAVSCGLVLGFGAVGVQARERPSDSAFVMWSKPVTQVFQAPQESRDAFIFLARTFWPRDVC